MSRFDDDIDVDQEKVIHTQCHDCQCEPYNETTKKYDLYKVWAPDKELVLVCDDCRYIRRGKRKWGEAEWLLRWQILQDRITHAKPGDVFTHSRVAKQIDKYQTYVATLPRNFQEFVEQGLIEKLKKVARR